MWFAPATKQGFCNVANPVIPKYVFVVDWQDQRAPLPPDHVNAVTPIDFDFNYGAQLFDYYRMVGLNGAIRIHDPQGLLDPLTHDKTSTRYRELSVPHRFWMYALDSQPPDLTVRAHGFAVVDRRPDKDHARIRLVSREFVRLRDDIIAGRFNTYAVIPDIPDVRRPSVRRPASEARVNNITVDGFNDSFTSARLTVYFKDGDADPVTGEPGFHVDNVYVRWAGATNGSVTLQVAASPHSFEIPVTPGGVYVVEADIDPELTLPHVTAPFTVPTGDVTAPPSITLSVTRTHNTASIIASVSNAPEGNQQVTFTIGTQTRTSGVSLTGIATAQFSNLQPSTTYEVTATLDNSDASRSQSFTTTAAPTDPGAPDPETPVTTVDPQIEIDAASFSVQHVLGNRIRITGRVTDINNAGGNVNNIQIFQTYRLATSNTPIGLAGTRTNTAGEFTSDHAITDPSDQPYLIVAVTEGGGQPVTRTFSFTTSTIAPTATLDTLTAAATGATTATFTAVVSNPTSAGTVWFRYRRRGTASWVTNAVARPAGQGIVTRNVTGLTPSTTYDVQASIASASTLFTRSAFFTTGTVRVPMSIVFAAASGIGETSATVTVRLQNVPSGVTPQISFRVGGRTYAQLATLSQFAGWSATFNVTGLTANTPYVFIVTARAGIETDTDGVSFTTDAPIVVVREASITSLSVTPAQTAARATHLPNLSLIHI